MRTIICRCTVVRSAGSHFTELYNLNKELWLPFTPYPYFTRSVYKVGNTNPRMLTYCISIVILPSLFSHLRRNQPSQGSDLWVCILRIVKIFLSSQGNFNLSLLTQAKLFSCLFCWISVHIHKGHSGSSYMCAFSKMFPSLTLAVVHFFRVRLFWSQAKFSRMSCTS